jgi:hypothetical protein
MTRRTDGPLAPAKISEEHDPPPLKFHDQKTPITHTFPCSGSEVVQLGDNHVFGTGNFWGVTFNDAGSGPLHKGAVVCPYTLELMNGSGPFQGSCAWSDGGGDGGKIFTSYTGKIAASGPLDGALKITGGTGKFKGIQGQGSFQCTTLNDKGQYSCVQQFDYSLK